MDSIQTTPMCDIYSAVRFVVDDGLSDFLFVWEVRKQKHHFITETNILTEKYQNEICLLKPKKRLI